mgnify:CR=1 FL=1
MDILIAIPCFNEEDNIEETLSNLTNLTSRIKKHEFKFLVVDDGSFDNTKKILAGINSEIDIVSSVTNQGLSEVFNSIMHYAKKDDFDYLIVFDADMQYPVDEINNLLSTMDNLQSDIVIGCRNFETDNHFGKTKNLIQKYGSRFISYLVKVKISDITSGFRIYSKRAIGELFSSNNFTYTTETLFQAAKLKLKINTVLLKSFNPTRESRLFNSNFSYIIKTIKIIFSCIFLYRYFNLIFLVTLIASLPGLVSLSRFFIPYIIYGSNSGNVQSLIVGVGYFITLGLIIIFSYLVNSNSELRKLIEKSSFLPKHN